MRVLFRITFVRCEDDKSCNFEMEYRGCFPLYLLRVAGVNLLSKLVTKVSEYGRALMQLLELEKGIQGRLLSYIDVEIDVYQLGKLIFERP